MRPVGRDSMGVKGIRLSAATTWWAWWWPTRGLAVDRLRQRLRQADSLRARTATSRAFPRRWATGWNCRTARKCRDGAALAEPVPADDEPGESPADEPAESEEEESRSSQRYRTQGRGGKGVRDIKTTERNGPVIGIAHVDDEDEVMMITARGQIQRIPVNDINIKGRNTQGVRIMNLDEGDRLVAVKRVPHEEDNGKSEADAGETDAADAAVSEPGSGTTDA